MDEFNEQVNPTDNATPNQSGISGNGEDPKLNPKDKERLTKAVMQMTNDGIDDETIKKAVSNFKNKYGIKPAATPKPVETKPVGATAVSEPIQKPTTQPNPEQPEIGGTVSPKTDSNPKEVGKPTLEVGEVKSEGIVPERPTTYQGLPITYGETDDSGVVDFGNGINLPASVLPKEEKAQPVIRVAEYISSLGPDGKQPVDITGQTITKDAENKMYEDWQTKGWGKIVKTDENTGRFIFAPNEEGRDKIKKVYEEQLGYNKPMKEEEGDFLGEYAADIHKKYGVLLTNEDRAKLGTKEGRDSLEIDLQAKQLVKNNPNLSYDQAWDQVANEYSINSNETSRDLASNFFYERLTQMRWGKDEDTKDEAEWIKSTMGNQDMMQQFGQFLQSDEGKAYSTSTNKFLSTMNQKDMKDVVNAFFQYENKQNMINTQANIEQYKDTQAKLVNSAKSGNVDEARQVLQSLNESGEKIRSNDTQAQNLFLQQQAINGVFTEANYWEDKAGEYYGDVENGKRTVENVINGSSLMATNAVKRTAGGILSVFLSPMTMMGDENKQDYYDLVRAMGKPLEMKGVKLHDAFYSQEVGKDKNGIEYVRLDDGKVYQRTEDGQMQYLTKEEYDLNDIKFDKTEHEWSTTGIANAVQSFGWDVYMAGGIGNVVTKPIAALSEYAAVANATKNLARAGVAIGEESAVTRGLANFTRAMRSPHTATNAGFFTQMYQDNLIKAKDAGIESDLGASMYATLNSAFDSFLISKVVPEFKMGQLNNQVRAITRNLAENKMASASQGMYNFLKETAPNMAHTYLTMLAIETKTKLTDTNLNTLTDAHFNVDNSESIFASSAKGALPLVLFSMISKSPMMMRNKAVLNEQLVDLSKMDKDQIMVSLARQGDHIFPLLKNEAQNAYFKSYGDEVNNIADRIKEKQVLIQKIPNYEKYSDKDLTDMTDLMELKQKKQTEIDNADGAFKSSLNKDIKNIDLQIEEIANGKTGTSTKTGSEKGPAGAEGKAGSGETENKKTETLIKDPAVVERLKKAGVTDEILAALPENFHINDRLLMGDKDEPLMQRLAESTYVGGRSYNTVTTSEGRVTKYDNARVDLNRILGFIYGTKDRNTVHEAAHAATIVAMNDIKVYNELPDNKKDGRYTPEQADAVDSLEFFAKYMKEKLDTGKIKADGVSTYGLTNGFEFVAEFMSNKKFRNWILTSEYEAGIKQNKEQNIVRSIYDKIMTVIGLKSKDKEVLVKDMGFQKDIERDINTLLEHQRRIYGEAEFLTPAERDRLINEQKAKDESTKTENSGTESTPKETERTPVSEEKKAKINDIDQRRDLELNKLDEPLHPVEGVTENYEQAMKDYKEKLDKYNNEFEAIDAKYDAEIDAIDTTPKSEPYEGAAEIHKNSKELTEIGTDQEYKEYLKTVFPESSMTDVVHHLTKHDFEAFERKPEGETNKTETEGIHFVEEQAVEEYKNVFGKNKKSVILDFKNPIYTEANVKTAEKLEFLTKDGIKEFEEKGYDSGIIVRKKDTEYVAFHPEQIHILGSKKDAEDFRKWKEGKTPPDDFSRIDLSEQLGINKVNDFLDGLNKKLDDFGKDNLGMNIPVVVLKGALTAMRGAVKTAKVGADVISAGLNHVRETSWYKKLSDEQKKEFEDKGILAHFDDLQNKKAAEAVVKNQTEGKSKPVKTQVRESSGQADTSKKVNISEKGMLREKFKNLQRGFKTGAKEVQELKKGFIDQLKEDIKGLGKDMNQGEINSLLNQVGKINDKNIAEVEAVVNRVIDKIEARQDRKELSSLKNSLKKFGKSKGKAVPRNIRDLAQNATIIDERYLSEKSREEYKDVLAEIRDTFRPSRDDNYRMVDYDRAMDKLAKLNEESEAAKVEELVEKMGIDVTGLTTKEIKDLWREENADLYAENLSEKKQKEAHDAFINQAEYSQIGLEYAETDGMTGKEKAALKVLKEMKFKDLPLETIKQYIKIADNIITNKDFSNAGAIVAKVKADRNVASFINYINSKGIKPKRIDRDQNADSILGVPVSSVINPLEWVKHGVDYMTTLNVFMEGVMGGSEAGAKLYNDAGFFDMSNARVRATVRKTNFDNYYNGLVHKLSKKNPAITEGKEVVKRSIFGTLLQADRESSENMEFYKKSYIEKSIKSLEAYSSNKQAQAKIEILKETLNQLKDVNTKEELIDYLKTNEPDNFRLLKAASDYFLRHSQEFSDNSYFNHGERFDPRTADDFYLPLTRQSLVNKSMRTKVDEVKGTVASSFNRPSQAMSGSVFSRERQARLQESETINFDFDSMVSNKMGEQLYDMESAQEILKMKAILTHPEMKKAFGSTIASLTDKALDKIAIDSGVAMNSSTNIEKNIIKIERVTRKIASVNALGGVDQYLKQYPSVIIGAGIRLGRDMHLLPKYMFTNKADIELLKMSSIRMRKEADAGTKRVSDDVKFTELSVAERNAVQRVAVDLSKGLGIGIDKAREISMLSLRMGDVNAAGTTFLAYYHSFLLKHGVKEADIDMRTEHAKVETDPVRKDALAYAQHMINTTQTSSDLSEGSKMATSPHVMAKIMSGILIPFSTFSNNAMIRLAKAVGNVSRSPKENSKEIAASLTEIVAFQSIKALAIAPAAAIIGSLIFGGDDEEQENVVDWAFQVNKMASGVIGDVNPAPDSFDIDAINYMVYLKNRDKIKEQIGWEGDFSYRDYDIWRKKSAANAKKKGLATPEVPYHFYRFGDQDGWDVMNGAKSDLGMYDIPKKQVERTVEAWDVLLDGKKEGYNDFGGKETYNFGDEHRNLLMFYTLYETAASIGLSDATSRRMIEKQFDKIKRESKEDKDKKSNPKKDNYKSFGKDSYGASGYGKL
jgi:ribosomal protein L17